MRTLRVLSSIVAVRPVTVLAEDTSYSIVRSGRRDFGRVVGNPQVTSYEHPIDKGKFAHSEVSTT